MRPAALFVAVLLAVCACGSREERAEARLARAESLVEAARPDDAIIELHGALKLDPSSAEANQRLGELLRARGADQLAVHHFGEAHRLDPARIDAALAQANLLLPGDPARAARIVARLARRHPEDPRVARAASSLAIADGDLDRALDAARRAVTLDADDRESRLHLASVHRARAAEQSVADPEAALRAALAVYDELESRSGGDVDARIGRAQALASQVGRRDEAAAAFRAALTLAAERDDTVGRRRAAVALERHARGIGDDALQREALRHQTEATPERLGAWERLANVTERLEGDEAAQAVMAALVARFPASPAARIQLSSRLAHSGRIDDAVAAIERALADGLDAPSLQEQAVRLELSRGRLDAARARAEALARAHPGEVASRRAAARVDLAAGRPEDAAAHLDAASETRANAESEALRAGVELARGRTAAALAAAERAAALAPGFSAPAQRLLAHVGAEAGAWETARAALAELARHGVALSPAERLIGARADYEAGEIARGRAALDELLALPDAPAGAAAELARRHGDAEPDVARGALERALEAAPSDVAALEALAHLLLRSGAPDRALARVDRGIAADGGEPRLWLLRARLLARAGRLAPAEADALRVLEARPDLPDAVGLLLAIYRARGEIDEARRSFEEAESAGVLHPGARLLLARLRAAAGDVAGARDAYERVLADRPGLATAKNDLAFLLASRGEQLERALDLARDARRALPESAHAADTLGAVWLALGRPGAAEAEFLAALARAAPVDPSRPTYHHHLGLALDALGRPGEAAAQWERALTLDADFPEAAEARARLAAIGGRADTDPDRG